MPVVARTALSVQPNVSGTLAGGRNTESSTMAGITSLWRDARHGVGRCGLLLGLLRLRIGEVI